jgi:outer membrane beta-barrel protein
VKVRARDRWLRLLTLAGLLIGMTTLAGLARADDDVEDTGEVAAIQNRAYRMGQELELGVSLLPENAFFKGVAPELGYTIHFSDSYGLEIRGAYTVSFNTGLQSQLLQLGTQPTNNAFEETGVFVTGDFVWSPIYIKGTLGTHTVIHGEGFLLVGGGAFEEVLPAGGLGNFYPAPNIGAGFRIFLSKTFSVRLDVRDNVLIDSNFDNILDVNLGISINFLAPE